MANSILLVDDDDDARTLLGKFLDRRGIEVFSAACGKDAIDIYKEKRPQKVFLDVRLPDMDGVSVFTKIREFDPQAIIFFVTGSTDGFSFQKKAKEIGAAGYVSKPITLDDILEIIK